MLNAAQLADVLRRTCALKVENILIFLLVKPSLVFVKANLLRLIILDSVNGVCQKSYAVAGSTAPYQANQLDNPLRSCYNNTKSSQKVKK